MNNKQLMSDYKQLLADLYEGKKYLVARFTDPKRTTTYPYNVVMCGRDKTPDCYITSFGANQYFRTEKGVNREKYATYGRLLGGIKHRAKEVLKNFVMSEVTFEIVTLKGNESLPLF